MNIQNRVEGPRGCGYRKEGGIYLVAGGMGQACGKLPIPLTVCPCCHAGVKPARGWTWITPELIFGESSKAECKGLNCLGCPVSDAHLNMMIRADKEKIHESKFGLLWIGEAFYGTPQEFTKEANNMGVSRRLSAVPKDFVIGETWVLVAHRKAIQTVEDGGEISFAPGIFHAFKPSAIEYVVKADDDEEKLESMEKRGFTLIRVIKEEDLQTKLSE